ncbi:uracil transporter FurD [Cryptococcus deuterogattii 99/473]|uniref:Uracil transporter FurD n=3 Tax=Cryptococcus gattii species complex TaxID=1884637 RepID=A0A0D0TT26_9TREE|nr:uracil transporter FurD [Cryptococcus deuterogattii R265]KIR25374.1 uracil transporter FurD [Cryptococcus deuterogattii LA55]KIR31430.1 uracil transporter FurD [Cryptococcus deuterogattii MMRL2647]KIR38838.1 uracil transporter FurD [Cryptococcus deuterogattii Ram5]KIR71022.1 uracil transporter FurD [Cryptococcus deuterogattii CA1014]KIR90633.1 uracil transporter FurD [Cryptococcus deuterogattii CBS 10090]KIR97368.1 uracil transporter FurD [Cryptococcus deuterogattii 2001/935-1]KIY57850.1 
MTVTQTIRNRLTRPSAWVLPKEESCIAPEEVWSNKDMDPAPLEHRRWTSWTFFAYWISDLITPGGWATSSSFVEMGLTWWESCLAMYVGGFLVAIVITANGIIGAKLHTPFAITSRSVYGYWGSKFVVFSRMACACFWLSINSWSGGVFISLMIKAIWPQYANLKNTIPASQGATSADFLSFFLFWLLQFPFIFIHPSKLKWVFNAKAFLVVIVAVGTMIWALVKAGSHAGEALGSPANRAAGGIPRFKAFMYAVTASQSTWATLSVNIGDFSRYCKKPSASYIQLLVFPILYAGLSFFASITASCASYVYGSENSYYQPYDIVALWNTSAGGRCAMFLASFVWALCNVTTNITANSISAANDMTSLAPKYINIQRGQLIAVTIGVWGFVPWKVLATASNFLTFMASYSIVLAPIAVIMVTDFFLVKKQKVDIYELYKPHGIYRFSKGWNWRAYIALAVAVAPNLPGMVNAINSSIDIGNIKYVYMVSNIIGNTIALTVYLVLNYVFPATESHVSVPIHDLINPEEDYGAAYGIYQSTLKNGEKDVETDAEVKSALV